MICPSRKALAVIAALAALALSACGSPAASPSAHSASAPPETSAAPAASPSATPHHHHHAAAKRHHPAQAAAHRSACGTGLWRHIYHPDRLRLVTRCLTVHGTVTELRWEPDGDLHIRLATRASLVNSVNDQYQAGDLVLEEICQGTVSQADAVAACSGVPRDLTVPSVGDKVTVSGSYVLDQDHGWMEIHPVTSLTVTGHVAAPAPPPATTAPAPAAGGCHPTTPSGNCYEPGEFCSSAEHNESGVAGDGKAITCVQDGSYWRWLS